MVTMKLNTGKILEVSGINEKVDIKNGVLDYELYITIDENIQDMGSYLAPMIENGALDFIEATNNLSSAIYYTGYNQITHAEKSLTGTGDPRVRITLKK